MNEKGKAHWIIWREGIHEREREVSQERKREGGCERESNERDGRKTVSFHDGFDSYA